jgi:hypothetical protein
VGEHVDASHTSRKDETAVKSGAPDFVTATGDIVAHGLSKAVAGHRIDYWQWVQDHADPASRDTLLALRDHWRDCNARCFDGIMLEPYITLTEPSAPRIYGQCCSLSSWGSRLEIKLRPSLLDGTHPHMRGASTAGRTQFAKDVLLHEMIHQHVMEHQPGVNEESYHGHGPVFTEDANRIGAALGLPEVVVRNRAGKKLPKAAQWPHCVAPPERYGGALKDRSRVTSRRVTIPVEYAPSASESVIVDGDAFLDIDFDPASGEGPTIRLRLQVDTAYQLADIILDDGDDE